MFPVERLEMKKQAVDYMKRALDMHAMENFLEVQRALINTIASEDRLLYERLMERLKPAADESVDPTFEILTMIALLTGVVNKNFEVREILRAGHILATLRANAKAFVIFVKFGHSSGKSAFVSAAQSSKLASDILDDGERVVKNASRAARLLKVVASTGINPDAQIRSYIHAEENDQRYKLQVMINDLYLRRFYESLCDVIMVVDGLLLSYIKYVTEKQQMHANEMARLIMTTVTRAWRNVDTVSSLNASLETDYNRPSWREEDPDALSVIQDADDMKALLGLASRTHHDHVPYEFTASSDMYTDTRSRSQAAESDYIDVNAENQDIDRLFAKFLPLF
ncbi:hypothetical protein AMATHDRAFT_6439 [Amanita thiersii Skay4041]|uniref:Uncharacterized protein n=1 Tax=Amanita thiersii Skay4041 TaxID=703135 RepID=A0A2A9NHL1_9AGAR|nr:hypothetical protein AMATHDRAFT_6439 [Amanita thiersii Skay4041]